MLSPNIVLNNITILFEKSRYIFLTEYFYISLVNDVQNEPRSCQAELFYAIYGTYPLISSAEVDTTLHICVQEIIHMEGMVVYLGSDRVIKTPDFDFWKNSLRVSTTIEDAKQQAHKIVGMGVVSVYQLDLEHLVTLEDVQGKRNCAENVDIIHHTSQTEYCLYLCSEQALKALSFVGATFTN